MKVDKSVTVQIHLTDREAKELMEALYEAYETLLLQNMNWRSNPVRLKELQVALLEVTR